jgi:hypothetical protein
MPLALSVAFEDRPRSPILGPVFFGGPRPPRRGGAQESANQGNGGGNWESEGPMLRAEGVPGLPCPGPFIPRPPGAG